MMKVDNRNIVSSVAKTTYKANHKRNILTIFAVILTTFLITSVIGIGISYWNTLSERSIRMNGMDYDIELTEPREEQVEKIRRMKNVRNAGVVVKCAIVEEGNKKQVSKIQLFWADTICWEKQCIPAFELLEGNYPEKENEIVLSTTALKDIGIKNPEIGMEISMSYYPLNGGEEQKNFEKNFQLSGYFRDYSGRAKGFVSRSFYDGTGAKQTILTQGSLKISLKNPLYSKQDIIDMQNEIGLEDKQIIKADYDTISNFIKTSIGLAGLLLMIFISGYLFIYNTLYLSIFKDIRYYGQLKTIGMTSVQLKRMVYKQALWNSCIGIPIGLLLGAVVSIELIPTVLRIMNPVLQEESIAFVNPVIYLGATFFSAFTVFISSRKPAIMAGECAPIEAVKYTGYSIKKKIGQEKRNGLRSMAWRNMFRDKKQAFIILGSFFIALTLFFIVNVVIRENDGKRILNEISSYDMQIRNDTTLEENIPLITDEKIKELENIEGVKSVGKVTSTVAVVPYQEEVFGTYYQELYQSRYSPGNYENDIEEYKKDPNAIYGMFNTRLIGINEEEFEKLDKYLNGRLSLKKKEFEEGKIALVERFLDITTKDFVGKTVVFSLPDSLETEKEHSIIIEAVLNTGENPAYFAGGYTPAIIVSEQYAKKLMGTTYTELVDVEYEKPFDSKTEEQVKRVFAKEKQISFSSKLERYKEMEKTEIQVKILGNGIGIILAVLAILNYSNMMVAAVQNRSKEFATLESLGMTSKQIKKVLSIEGLGYAVISIVIALILAVPFSYMIFQNMNIYRISFSIPVIENLILFISVVIICVIVPPYIYSITQKESVIERLREID